MCGTIVALLVIIAAFIFGPLPVLLWGGVLFVAAWLWGAFGGK